MRNRLLVGGLVVAIAVFARANGARAAAATRKPLGRVEREAVLALIKAVELAQSTNADANPALVWDYHIFKSTELYRLRAVHTEAWRRRRSSRRRCMCGPFRVMTACDRRASSRTCATGC